MQHRRQGKFIKLMHRTFDSLPLAVAGIPDILCFASGQVLSRRWGLHVDLSRADFGNRG
jgi:hypothetical protein